MSTQNLHVIKASAGSGKTYTLAKLYIERLLWDGKGELRPIDRLHGYHEHILAITFTNKATEEMKSRIIEQLYLLSIGECEDYQDDFLDKHPNTTSDQLKQHSREALKLILFDYTTFNVSTIDSFFQVILRTFAHELDREYDYEIQLDSDYATLMAVHSFMTSLGDRRTGNLDTWVKKIVSSSVHDKKDWNFFGGSTSQELMNFAKILNDETFRRHRSEIISYLEAPAGGGVSKIEQFRRQVILARNRYQKYCDDFKDTLSAFFYDHGIDPSWLISSKPITKMLISSKKEDLGNSLKTIANYSETPDSFEKCFKKNTLTSDQVQSCSEPFRELLKQYFSTLDKISALNSLASNLWQLGLLGKIDEKLTEYRKDNNSILLSDTNDLIATVLEGGVDFLYERVGMWIHHFMMDEFQDTSRKQYSNFQPLLENSLSSGFSNLIIGDEKQSIYRFRNSDPDLLRTEVEKDFRSYYFTPPPLDTNFRSCTNIVQFNNRFFKALMEHYATTNSDYKKLQDTYKNLKQKVSQSKQDAMAQGNVRVNFVYTGANQPKYKIGQEELESKEQVLKTLPDYIWRLHTEQGYQFRDILILVNQCIEGNEVVQNLLEHNSEHPESHIDVVSSESLLLKNSPAVRLIVSMLRFIDSTQYHQSEDDDEEGDIMRKKDDELTPQQRTLKYRLKEQYHYKMLHDFGTAIGEHPDCEDPGQLLAFIFEKNEHLKHLNPSDGIDAFSKELEVLTPDPFKEQTSLTGLVDKIIHEYLEKTGMTRGAETSFLLAFQSTVLAFEQQRTTGGTVHEFLKYWENKKDKLSIPSGDDANAVQVMTIHKSKGLEAPCVIVPFANWKLIQPDRTVWMPSNVWLRDNANGVPFEGIGIGEYSEIVPPLIPVTDDFLAKQPEFAPYYNPIVEDGLIDKVNKTYVAFTRPRQSLHIFAFVSGGDSTSSDGSDKRSKTIGHLLQEIVPNIEGAVAHDWQETHPDSEFEGFIDYVEMGNAEPYVKKDEESKFEKLGLMPDYEVKSGLDVLEIDLPELVTESQETGNLMHRLMSRIRHRRDVTRAMKYAVKRRIVPDDDSVYWNLERATKLVDNMFVNPATRDWFADENRVYNERTIILPEDGATLRPDRVVVRPDGTCIVIDYKFGDATDKRQQAGYRHQVQRYMQRLHEMGYAKVEGYLWYVKHSRIEKVELTNLSLF